jgi:hypothetical protein
MQQVLSRPIKGLLVLIVLAFAIFFVYHPFILSGFDKVSGDVYDARIQIFILEHWRNVFSGKDELFRPEYFHPEARTIAFNDGYLISGIIYTVFREFGGDPFISYEFMNITIRIVGFVFSYLFLRRILSCEFLISLFAALLGFVAQGLAIRMNHSQLLYAYLVPAGLYLLMSLYRLQNTSTGLQQRPSAATLIFVIMYGAWALTAFYSLYVFTLITGLVFGSLLVLEKEAWLKSLVRRRVHFLLIGVGSGLSAIGIYALYRDVLKTTGGHRVGVIHGNAGAIIDLVNVGPSNFFWSDLIAPVYRAYTGSNLAYTELSTGFTPILLAAFVVSAVYVWALRRKNNDISSQSDLNVVFALIIASLVLAFFSLKTHGIAHWTLPFLYLPGASTIRVPARLLLFIVPIMVLVIGFALDRFIMHGPADHSWRKVIAIALVMIIVGEQYNIGKPFYIDRKSEYAFIEGIPTPPASCGSYYAFNPRLPLSDDAAVNKFYIHSVDAMLVASMKNIPTVNGFSTFTPVGVDLSGPWEPDYGTRIRKYAGETNLAAHICGLDLKEKRWIPGLPQF